MVEWYAGCVTTARRVALRDVNTRRKEMAHVMKLVRSFRRDEDGQDLLEYALLVALIALVAVGAVTAAGIKVDEIFDAIVAAIPA
jgi:pilus assembly protein Flp/PilA